MVGLDCCWLAGWSRSLGIVGRVIVCCNKCSFSVLLVLSCCSLARMFFNAPDSGGSSAGLKEYKAKNLLSSLFMLSGFTNIDEWLLGESNWAGWNRYAAVWRNNGWLDILLLEWVYLQLARGEYRTGGGGKTSNHLPNSPLQPSYQVRKSPRIHKVGEP